MILLCPLVSTKKQSIAIDNMVVMPKQIIRDVHELTLTKWRMTRPISSGTSTFEAPLMRYNAKLFQDASIRLAEYGIVKQKIRITEMIELAATTE